MDWSVPSEMIEALECANSSTNLQEEDEEEAAAAEEAAKGQGKLDPAARNCKGEGGVFTAVEDILANFCDAGEKLFVSVSSWVPWRSDDPPNPLPLPNCPHQSQREIQLIERMSAPHYPPKCAHCKVNMEGMEQQIVQHKERESHTTHPI